jgi:DNA processing protein
MPSLEADWLALSLVQGVGQKAIRRLLDRFGTVSALLEASPDVIAEAARLEPGLAARIARAREVDAYQMEQRLISRHGVRLLCLDQEDYPLALRDIQVPPPLLYCRGEVPLPSGWCLGVVGTRRQSRYGEKVTRGLIEQLAERVPDLVIVSGLARGADTTAHETALGLGLKTVAVLAGGLTGIYPPENADLAERITEQGTLVTEFAMAMKPLAKHFPIRNRIISGLSRGVLVTEAGEKSGALITAGFALNHGREVFAVPGAIDQPNAMGTHRLIQKGQAKLVTTAQDILEEFDFAAPRMPRQLDWLTPQPEAGRGAAAPYSEMQRKVMEHLRDEPMHPDELAQAVEVPVEKLLGVLLELELSGEVCQTTDNRYAMV